VKIFKLIVVVAAILMYIGSIFSWRITVMAAVMAALVSLVMIVIIEILEMKVDKKVADIFSAILILALASTTMLIEIFVSPPPISFSVLLFGLLFLILSGWRTYRIFNPQKGGSS